MSKYEHHEVKYMDNKSFDILQETQCFNPIKVIGDCGARIYIYHNDNQQKIYTYFVYPVEKMGKIEDFIESLENYQLKMVKGSDTRLEFRYFHWYIILNYEKEKCNVSKRKSMGDDMCSIMIEYDFDFPMYKRISRVKSAKSM